MAPERYFGEKMWNVLTTNLGAKIISLMMAIVLWVIVLGSRSVEVTKEIPIEIITPSDLVAANEIPDRIAFRLSGPKAFLRAILDRRETPIRVNLSGSKPGVVNYRFFSDNIRVPIGVKVLSINPASIPIRLEAVRKREVPVKVELRGTPPDGFRVLRTTLKPPTVRIKGAESRVESITELTSIPIDVSGLRYNMEREVVLDLSRYNVQIEGELPKVLIEVEAASANYRIKNVDIRVLTPHKSKLAEKTVTVFVRADAKDLKLLDRSHVYAIVDLSGKPKGEYESEVKVSVPDGVGLVKVVPDKVKVVLY